MHIHRNMEEAFFVISGVGTFQDLGQAAAANGGVIPPEVRARIIERVGG